MTSQQKQKAANQIKSSLKSSKQKTIKETWMFSPSLWWNTLSDYTRKDLERNDLSGLLYFVVEN